MWNYIIKKGKTEEKRGKVLYLYAHNAKYDFYSYANISDKHIRIYNHDPFIASYRNNGKEIIKFLDTMALWRTSLKNIGDTIGPPNNNNNKTKQKTKTKKHTNTKEKTHTSVIQSFMESTLQIILFWLALIMNWATVVLIAPYYMIADARNN